MTDQCSTCMFYVAPQCRYKAPANQIPGQASAAGMNVDAGYWCGDGIADSDGHFFSTKLNQGPQGPTGATGAAYAFGPEPATAAVGAATLNTNAGVITSESLTGATSYSLTLSNSRVLSTSVVLVNVVDSAGAAVSLTSLAITNGQVVAGVSMVALTGTLKFYFAVFN